VYENIISLFYLYFVGMGLTGQLDSKLFRVKLVRCYLGDQEEHLMISQVLYLLKIIGMYVYSNFKFQKS